MVDFNRILENEVKTIEIQKERIKSEGFMAASDQADGSITPVYEQTLQSVQEEDHDTTEKSPYLESMDSFDNSELSHSIGDDDPFHQPYSDGQHGRLFLLLYVDHLGKRARSLDVQRVP